jgi:hypothetical protein
VLGEKKKGFIRHTKDLLLIYMVHFARSIGTIDVPFRFRRTHGVKGSKPMERRIPACENMNWFALSSLTWMSRLLTA